MTTPSYKERSQLIKALSEQQYFDAKTKKDASESVRIGDRDGSTGRYQILHQDGGVTRDGIKTFNQAAPQDGFVRMIGGKALDHRNRKEPTRVRAIDETKTCPVKILVLAENKIYISGDRSAELIYEIPEGYSFFRGHIDSTGIGLDDYIVQLVLFKDGLTAIPTLTPFIGSYANESSFSDFWMLVQFNGTTKKEKILPAFDKVVHAPISIQIGTGQFNRSLVDYQWIIPKINGYGWWSLLPIPYLDGYGGQGESTVLYYRLNEIYIAYNLNSFLFYTYMITSRPSFITVFDVAPSGWFAANVDYNSAGGARFYSIAKSNLSFVYRSSDDFDDLAVISEVYSTSIPQKISNDLTLDQSITTTTQSKGVAIGDSIPIPTDDGSIAVVSVQASQYALDRFNQGQDLSSQLVYRGTSYTFYFGEDIVELEILGTEDYFLVSDNLSIQDNKIASVALANAFQPPDTASISLYVVESEYTTAGEVKETEVVTEISLISIPSETFGDEAGSYEIISQSVAIAYI